MTPTLALRQAEQRLQRLSGARERARAFDLTALVDPLEVCTPLQPSTYGTCACACMHTGMHARVSSACSYYPLSLLETHSLQPCTCTCTLMHTPPTPHAHPTHTPCIHHAHTTHTPRTLLCTLQAHQLQLGVHRVLPMLTVPGLLLLTSSRLYLQSLVAADGPAVSRWGLETLARRA